MKNSLLALLTFALLNLCLVGCSKVEYDYKTLGFSDKAAMEAAFAKGYHTKQKFDEMSPKVASAPKAAATAPESTALSPQDSANEKYVTTQASTGTVAAAATKVSDSTVEIPVCTTLQTCVNSMLAAARAENMGEAVALAKQFDELTKPVRGDRKAARKLNLDGLNSLKTKSYEEAVKSFIEARVADPLDDEVVGNLAYTYGEAKQFAQSEKAANEALLLNPRRANYWSTLAVAKQGQGKQKEALQAMWLVWQFAPKKEALIEAFDKRINEETDQNMKSLYISSKSWLVEGKKPNF